MARKEVKGPITDNALNNINHNFIELYNEFVSAGMNAQEALNKVNQMVGIADNALKVAKQSDSKSDDTQQQLDDIILKDGNDIAEVVQARGGNPLLKDRLNKTDEQLADIAINVKVFGAVADANYYNEKDKKYYIDAEMSIDSTDNQQAFQAAVDYVNENGGGTVFVPRGRYMLGKEIIWKTGVSLKGDGAGSSVLCAQGRQFSLIDYRPGETGEENRGDLADDPEAWLYDCHFEDFEIDMIGLSDTHSTVEGKAMFMLYMRRCSFRDLVLKNSIGTALGCDFLDETIIDGVKVYNAGRNWGVPRESDGRIISVGQSGIGIGTAALESETVVISNCHVFNCGNYGIFVETQQRHVRPRSKHAKIINCHVEGNRIGLGNRGSGPTIFESCTIYKNTEMGFKLQRNSYGDIISNCIIEENNGEGIFLDRSYDGDILITNNQIIDNNYRGIMVDVDPKYDHVTKVINILNNKISGNSSFGIDFGKTNPDGRNKTKNVSIKNNVIYNNCQTSGSDGVRLRDIKGLNLIGNTIYDNQETRTQLKAFSLNEKVEGYFIDGNDFTIENEGSRMLYSRKGVIGTNIGLNYKKNDESRLSDGQTGVWVNHYMSELTNLEAPNAVIKLTPKGNQQLWIAQEEPNRFRVGRDSSEGELEFYWEISLIQQ